nr:Chain C, Protein W [Hendra virus horse/Australia/Hendra/1994]6BW9_B Chain B, Protein W [Hendra virus horse/Australia/Hendra/1994]6BWA_B Chain B, Protein W [Hendra virus horse/Australia/Hendra/1994]6BWB_B Chain B, Protein W [Hendra virus horse/Australia/Hendra/1994]
SRSLNMLGRKTCLGRRVVQPGMFADYPPTKKARVLLRRMSN